VRKRRRRRAPLPILHADAVAAVAGRACARPSPACSAVDRGYRRRVLSGGEVKVLAGGPAAASSGDGGDRWLPRPAAQSSILRLPARPSARSSVGRERRRGILVLTGAVGALAGPEGRDDDPAASGNPQIVLLCFDCMNLCR
jgi:hypothetical protein